ncbi:acyl-CoA carboxylase subunit beta [Natrinema halophilum]|uniref:acyl-CoA carboxylase subunit beta n=1 Tax=Natrinema halophilum TaxID=1699371 RepID=UPI001F1BDDCC|nr:carboxyl transferase domain-containing protein [Natrinema halophilum]UHQ96282.1 acyl-CoA carboxylase [Natrinema halophilum]
MPDRHDRSPRELLDDVLEEKRNVSDEGRPESVDSQHSRGALTARERIKYLCDDNTFFEIGKLAAPSPTTPEVYDWTREDAPADGMVTGVGKVLGRSVAIVAPDYTVKGGSLGRTADKKTSRTLELALRRGIPVVMLQEGSGRRIQEGLDARAFTQGDQDTLKHLSRLSGWVPLVGAMMGQGFGGPTNAAVMCDFIPMVEDQSTMGIAGPTLVEAALGRDISKQELGGPQIHVDESGIADVACEDERATLDTIKLFLSYFPKNASTSPPTEDSYTDPSRSVREQLLDIVPTDPNKAYDMYTVIEGLVDKGSTFELKSTYAKNIITTLARMGGRPVGILANNPQVMAGTIDVDAAVKASHFVSLCDAFHIPLVFLCDIPGTLPGPESEKEGLAKYGGKVVFELNRATVPKISVGIRRAYGLGQYVMALGDWTDTDLTVVWPTAEISAMGIEGAVDIAYHHQVEQADDPEAEREALIEKFTERSGALRAAEGMGIDEVIDPRETRKWILHALELGQDVEHGTWPPKKHGINPI